MKNVNGLGYDNSEGPTDWYAAMSTTVLHK